MDYQNGYKCKTPLNASKRLVWIELFIVITLHIQLKQPITRVSIKHEPRSLRFENRPRLKVWQAFAFSGSLANLD